MKHNPLISGTCESAPQVNFDGYAKDLPATGPHVFHQILGRHAMRYGQEQDPWMGPHGRGACQGADPSYVYPWKDPFHVGCWISTRIISDCHWLCRIWSLVSAWLCFLAVFISIFFVATNLISRLWVVLICPTLPEIIKDPSHKEVLLALVQQDKWWFCVYVLCVVHLCSIFSGRWHFLNCTQ